MLRYCRYSWTVCSCVKRWRKTCHVELVSESAKNPKMLVRLGEIRVFEKLHQNKGLTALNITSNKFLFARAHQIWSRTPCWSQKTHGLLEAVLLVSSCRCDTTHGYGMVYIYICMCVCMYVHIYMHATILLYIYIFISVQHITTEYQWISHV